ncbi:hypothetical protein RND81_11G115300 [Saponaria officinalis]|uniref:Reverse transcriptase zinc-binding domain-containing protein n=1 Tax=Saponaria officinalis TaxID=3572 RepID=A0AAW1HKR3_SAPOF
MLRAFETFSMASGLKMSPGKSNIYSNGVADSLISRIESEVGIQRGRVPFKYLGVNISPKRLSVAECAGLVDRVVEKIRVVGVRNISYAGRVVIIKSVLMSLHSYWARIFILPKTVLNRIEAICRSFLWHGSGASDGPALVAWEKVCRPRKNGGLGFYVWWIQNKADHLWVRWVHAIYLKRTPWENYTPSCNTSWGWHKICWVKQLLAIEAGACAGTCYNIRDIYSKLVDEGTKVAWNPWVCTRLFFPKHRFIMWLIVQGRLLTQDRLVRMGIIHENCWFLCGMEEESHWHIFFTCVYSYDCARMVARWLGVTFSLYWTIDWWLRLRTRSLIQKQVIGLALASLFYRIWGVRNKARIESFIMYPRKLCNEVREDVLSRIRVCRVCSLCPRGRDWLEGLQSRVCM